jgi:RNA polymerase sigma factor (sigma-70 family)
MQPRQNLVVLFSTFLQFEADRASGWATDARLRRGMQAQIANTSDAKASEQFWSTYWHQRWCEEQTNGTFLGHLSAYLQEACYWSAYKTSSAITESRYRTSDYFQIAIAEVPKILKARDPNHFGSLKTYASQAFKNVIRDFLRQSREVDICSDWGLLLKLSRKRFNEALVRAGLNATTIEQYLLAWTCFETIYLPTKSPSLRKLPTPDRDTWKKIADLYNQQRKSLQVPGDECTGETIAAWLSTCTRHIRSYLNPSVASLNAPKPGYEAKEWQDDLPDETRETLLDDLIEQEEETERATQQGDVSEVLRGAIAKLDSTAQELLALYYQQGMTQQQIAKHLNVQQYTVSRKLSKARETLLLALSRWSQETLHISPSPDVIKNISLILEDWLQERLK